LPCSLIVVFQLEGDVEMVLDRALAATGDEDHLLDPRLARLIYGIPDQRPIDDRQLFLGNGLGGRQKADAEPVNRNTALRMAFTACPSR